MIGEEGARTGGTVRGRLSTGVQVQRDTMEGNLRGQLEWKRENTGATLADDVGACV